MRQGGKARRMEIPIVSLRLGWMEGLCLGLIVGGLSPDSDGFAEGEEPFEAISPPVRYVLMRIATATQLMAHADD